MWQGNSSFSNGNSFGLNGDWQSLPWLFRQGCVQASVQR